MEGCSNRRFAETRFKDQLDRIQNSISRKLGRSRSSRKRVHAIAQITTTTSSKRKETDSTTGICSPIQRDHQESRNNRRSSIPLIQKRVNKRRIRKSNDYRSKNT